MANLAKVLGLGLISTAQAVSSCNFVLERYSDSTCTTLYTNANDPIWSTGQLAADLDFHKCWQPVANDNFSIEMFVCDEKKLLSVFKYKDSSCVQADPDPVFAYSPGLCQAEGQISYKVTSIKLTGNRFGIDWNEGWSIFLCQTLLFGVCDGY